MDHCRKNKGNDFDQSILQLLEPLSLKVPIFNTDNGKNLLNF